MNLNDKLISLNYCTFCSFSLSLSIYLHFLVKLASLEGSFPAYWMKPWSYVHSHSLTVGTTTNGRYQALFP